MVLFRAILVWRLQQIQRPMVWGQQGQGKTNKQPVHINVSSDKDNRESRDDKDKGKKKKTRRGRMRAYPEDSSDSGTDRRSTDSSDKTRQQLRGRDRPKKSSRRGSRQTRKSRRGSPRKEARGHPASGAITPPNKPVCSRADLPQPQKEDWKGPGKDSTTAGPGILHMEMQQIIKKYWGSSGP